MIKSFLNYVEIMTKITSIFAFAMTIAYFFYADVKINWVLTGLFFSGMFIFDLTTTAINNYIDTKTNTQTLPFSRKTAFVIICVMLAISVVCGLLLAYLTDLVVLIVGGLCFVCGVFYTFGPLPISRMPLGEVFSGLFYGLFIPFLLFYINMPTGELVCLMVSTEEISLSLKLWPMIVLILLSVAPTMTTANIMLANNICDLEKDIAVKRHTLPYYLGVRKSVTLFAGLYYITYLSTILMVVLGVLHPLCLLFLITLVPVQKNIKVFKKEQIKETTFLCAIKNYILIMSAQVVLIAVTSFI